MRNRRRNWALLSSTSAIASSFAFACGPSSEAGSSNHHALDLAAGPQVSTASPPTAPGTQLADDAGFGALSGDSGAHAANGPSVPMTDASARASADAAKSDPATPAPLPVSVDSGLPMVNGSRMPAADAGSASNGTTPDAASGPVVAQRAAMPIISQGLPAYANYAVSPASSAVDADYSTVWRTGHNPVPGDSNTLSIDLSSVPTANRTTVYSLWFNEYGYNYGTSDGSSYTLPGDFTIQGNAAPGGGMPPASGWTTLVTTAGNLFSSGANMLNLAPYNWVRFDCTASAQNVASQNTDTSLQWSLYDAHTGNDGWKFGGDSITANSMGHKATNDSFDQLVHAQLTNDPAFEMAGHGGWSTSTMLGSIDAFLADFPGLYFALALGTNDAPGNDAPGFGVRMGQLIDKILAAGKVPVVPTIPYTGEPTHVATIPAYNAEIALLYANYGAKVVPGPDLYAVIYNGRATMFDSATDLHPNAAGNAAIRAAWAKAMVKNVYGH